MPGNGRTAAHFRLFSCHEPAGRANPLGGDGSLTHGPPCLWSAAMPTDNADDKASDTQRSENRPGRAEKKPPEGPMKREDRLADALRANLRRRKAPPATPSTSKSEDKKDKDR